MLKAIIFDMDGVLINSTKYVTEAFNRLLKKFDVELTDKYRKKTLGRSLRDQIKIWKEDFDIKEDIDPIEFSNKCFSIELELMEKELKPNNVVINLINNLKKEGIKIGVATSSTKLRAEKILEFVGVKDKLDILITAEDVEKHKPDPELFLKAAECLEVNPENCIVFEDALNGIEAANCANMKTIACTSKFHSKEDFEGISNLAINDFSEINIGKLKDLLAPKHL